MKKNSKRMIARVKVIPETKFRTLSAEKINSPTIITERRNERLIYAPIIFILIDFLRMRKTKETNKTTSEKRANKLKIKNDTGVKYVE